ncbi:hypothetical protein BH10PLA1_BH10PLA1_17840 [soil metagenome]
MNEAEQRITESLAHAKDAAAVLNHIQLKSDSPAEAGAHAEIMAADELLAQGIKKLKNLQDESKQSE